MEKTRIKAAAQIIAAILDNDNISVNVTRHGEIEIADMSRWRYLTLCELIRQVDKALSSIHAE